MLQMRKAKCFVEAFGYRRVLGKTITERIESNYMTSWRRQNYGDSKKISGCQEFRQRREEKVNQRGFLGW